MAEPTADVTVVAVLGYSSRRRRDLHPVCAARLAYAERLADGASAVVLSGFARHPRGFAEAELMREAWAGPVVPLVCDPDARTTADNAANVVAAAARLRASRLVVVTSRWHRPRAALLLRAALGGRAVHLSVLGAPGPRSPLLVARELLCFVALPLHLRRARRAEPSRASLALEEARSRPA